MDIPEKGKQAAHVLIDAVSVTRTSPIGTANVAYQRLAEIKAFDVTIEDDDEVSHVTVDLSNVLGASLVTLDWLIEQVRMSTGRSREEIIVALREYIDD